MPSLLRALAALAVLAAAPVAAQSSCPQGFTPPPGQSDGDGDCIDDALERDGFRIADTAAGREVQACTPGTEGCFTTSNLAWSTDGDPYSDLQEAAKLNLPIEGPYDHPLVAAVPQIRVFLTGFAYTPIATITDTRGGSRSSSSETEVNLASTVTASYEVEAKVDARGPRSRTTARVEGTVSASYRNVTTTSESFNWETASTVDPSRAATVRLFMQASNEGGAQADNVRARFNLYIGGELARTIQMSESEPFPGILNPDGRLTDVVAIRRDADDKEIVLTLRELRMIQLGAPVEIQVVDLDAEVIRWSPETSSWSCNGSTTGSCPWDLFENEVNRQSFRLTLDFGYSGDPDADRPQRYFRSPYDYRVWVGSEGRTLRAVLRDLGLTETGDRIGDRPYPSAWFATDGPEFQASTGRTFFDTWQGYLAANPTATWPGSLMNVTVERQTSLALASPDPVDAGPVASTALFSSDLRSVIVEAAPRGSFAVTGGTAHLFVQGEERVVPLERVFADVNGGSVPTSSFRLPTETDVPISAEASYVVLRDVSDSERFARLASPFGAPETCADVPRAAYADTPGLYRQFGNRATVFVDGDLDTPATAYCYDDGGTPRTYQWAPVSGRIAESPFSFAVSAIAALDAGRYVVVSQGQEGSASITLYEDGAGISRGVAGGNVRDDYYAVAFREGGAPGAEIGVAVGTMDGNAGRLARTTDGGRTWTAVSYPGTAVGLRAVDYAGGDTWYAAGGNRVIRSTDNGLTWASVGISLGTGVDGNQLRFRALTAVEFVSESEGVVGDARMSDGRGRVYALSDGQWSFTNGTTGLTDIAYNGRNGWVITQGFSGSARVLHVPDLLTPSSSANQTTIAVEEPGAREYVAVDFGSAEVGFALRVDGAVRRTGDGGRTWQPASAFPADLLGGSHEMTDLFVLDENVAFVATNFGSHGWTTSGGGFPTYETPRVNVDEETGPAPEAAPVLALDAPAPNPVRQSARLAYALAEAGTVRLSVFDMLGREVAVLADGPRPAGDGEARFDARGLASGVYVVRLVAGGAVAVRTVTVVR